MQDREDIRLLGKGNKPRTIRVSFATLELFEWLGCTGAAVPTPAMRSEEVSMSSRFKQPSKSSSGTTGHDVAAELGHSSSLRLG
ncbi:hypothetical protein [Synechococcus sp. WH 8020]|uniref:hypothetical protein n=1 Tax=Synechococcus sp. (strain WH8020) TaxID=32052 RepID=UPI00069F896A|nr:hypothetical protein [Synechococcus sp. WH 8020]